MRFWVYFYKESSPSFYFNLPKSVMIMMTPQRLWRISNCSDCTSRSLACGVRALTHFHSVYWCPHRHPLCSKDQHSYHSGLGDELSWNWWPEIRCWHWQYLRDWRCPSSHDNTTCFLQGLSSMWYTYFLIQQTSMNKSVWL